MTSGRLNPKNLKMFTDMDRSDTLIRQLCPRAIRAASIGSGAGTPIFKALICHQRSRSRNVLIHLYLVNTKTTYKKFDIFYIDPLSDLRPDLEASGCCDFEYVTSFAKFQILAEISRVVKFPPA